MNEKNQQETGGDMIDASNSSGFNKDPTGPIHQHFGDNHYYGTPPLTPSTPQQRAKRLAQYRSHMLQKTAFINMAGIPLPRDHSGASLHLQMPLEKIYIRIQAIEQKQAHQEREDERRIVAQKIAQETIRGSSIFLQLQMLGEFFYRQGLVYAAKERPVAVDPQKALHQHGRLVMLGPPGSGKSTTLRNFARLAALQSDGPIPILIPLRDYAIYRGANGTESLATFALNQAAAGDVVLRDALEQAPKKLWLLDALDEARGWQSEVIDQIVHFAGDLVLTSRPIDYNPGALASIPHFEMLPLVPDDVNRFLDDWFTVLAERRGADVKWKENRVAWLKQQIKDRPRIETLTRSPLLLTFLVILAGEDPLSDLPTQRAQLYHRYVEELFTSWETERLPKEGSKGKPAFTLGKLEKTEAKQAALDCLYRVGWYLHLAYNDLMPDYHPTNEGLKRYLTPFLQKKWGRTEGESESLAKDILDFWSEAGLLDTWRVKGAEYLAFRHLTFQEYAAAWGLQQIWEQDANGAWEFVRRRLHHYGWREPLLLLATMLEQKRVSTLVTRLLKGYSRYERDLRRDLKLATTMLEEGARLPEKVIAQMCRVWQTRAFVTKRHLFLQHVILALMLAVGVASVIPGVWFSLLVGVGIGGLYGRGAYAISRSCYSRLLLLWNSIPVRYGEIRSFDRIGNRAIPILKTALKDDDSGVRREAAEALVKIGDPSAIPALQAALKDDDRDVRRSAAEALGKIGDLSAIPELQAALKDTVASVRKSAAEALGKIGDPSAISALQEALKDDDGEVRGYAAYALGEIDDPSAIPALQEALNYPHNMWVQVLLKEALVKIKIGNPSSIQVLQAALRYDDSDVRGYAARALGAIGNPSAIPALQEALKDDDSYVRRCAARALGAIGNPSAIPALQEALKDDDGEVRRYAVEALGEIGVPLAIPDLQAALKDTDASVRKSAFAAMRKIGGPSVIPALQEARKDDDGEVRRYAVEAMGKIGDPSAIPALQAALNDHDNEVRRYAALSLGAIGDPSAIPALQAALKDDDSEVRRYAVQALGKIDKPLAILSLQAALRDTDSGVRISATQALGKIGAPSAIPALHATLKDVDSEVRRYVAEALGKIGDLSAIPALQAALKDVDSYVRRSATYALRNIGDLSAIPVLQASLKDDDRDVRRNAAKALVVIGNRSAIPALQDALKDENKYVRRNAVEALGAIGDPSAIPTLQETLKDTDESVRRSATEALGVIGTPSAIPALLAALTDLKVRRRAAKALEDILVKSTDIRQVKKTAFRLWLAAQPEALEALETVANRLAVLEVQETPGHDPLSSPSKHQNWMGIGLALLVLVAAILAILFLPEAFWQGRIVAVIGGIASVMGIIGLSLRDLFARKER